MRFDYKTKEWKFDDCLTVRDGDPMPTDGRVYECLTCPNVIVFRNNLYGAFMCDDCIHELNMILDNLELCRALGIPRYLRGRGSDFCKICSGRNEHVSWDREPICNKCFSRYVVDGTTMNRLIKMNRLSSL